MSRLLAFKNLHNTRDLGGMTAADGRTIRPGALYRSGHLSKLQDEDAKQLQQLVSVIVDFRTDGEREEQPDTELSGTENRHIPIVDSLTAGISREAGADKKLFQTLAAKPAQAKAYMCAMYEALAGDFAAKQYSVFLSMLLETEGGLLWHCTAGKDRAGIASVIVEEILGIPREHIIEDYLKTNEYLQQDVKFLKTFVKKQAGIQDDAADEALQYLFGAEEDYILSYYRTALAGYGSFTEYVEEKMHFSTEMQEKLREKYLE